MPTRAGGVIIITTAGTSTIVITGTTTGADLPDPRGTPSDPHCPAASNGNRPGPSAIASPMAAGRCSYDGVANSNLLFESLVSAPDNLRAFAFGKAITPCG